MFTLPFVCVCVYECVHVWPESFLHNLYLDSNLGQMNNDRNTIFSQTLSKFWSGRPQENVTIQSPFWLLQHFLISLNLKFSPLCYSFITEAKALSRSFRSLCIEMPSLKYKFDRKWSEVTSVIISTDTLKLNVKVISARAIITGIQMSGKMRTPHSGKV